MEDKTKRSNIGSNPTRVPERYQNWDNFGLSYTNFSIRDLKEKSSTSSNVEIICGHCEASNEVPVQQLFASEPADDLQLSSFFKDKACPNCGVPANYLECFLDGALIIDTQFVPEAKN